MVQRAASILSGSAIVLAAALPACGKTKVFAYCERSQECAGAADPSQQCGDLDRAGVLSAPGDRCATQFEAWASCALTNATCEQKQLVVDPKSCTKERTTIDQCRGVNPAF